MPCVETYVVDGVSRKRDCRSGSPVAQPVLGDGPGTELKAILKDWFRIEANFGCSCNAMAKAMNKHGPEWVRTVGMQPILDAMKSEHARRAKKGQTILPWSQWGARQLVLLACARAERKAIKSATSAAS